MISSSLFLRYGIHPLHCATYWQQKQMMDWLITYNADVNKQDNKGQTPIFHLLTSPKINPDLIKFLIEKGASISIKNKSNISPFQLILDLDDKIDIDQLFGECKVSELIPKLKADDNILIKALNSSYPDSYPKLVKFLLDIGANVHLRDEHNQTALHDAAYRQNLEFMELLISRGADVNAQDDNKQTPLHILLFSNDRPPNENLEQLAQFLISKGANVSIKDGYNISPLDLMIKNKIYIDGILKQADYSTDIIITDSLEKTPDDKVAMLGDEEVGGREL